jgi:hypothetical protein
VGHARATRARRLVHESRSAFLAGVPIASSSRHMSLLLGGSYRVNERNLAAGRETGLKPW